MKESTKEFVCFFPVINGFLTEAIKEIEKMCRAILIHPAMNKLNQIIIEKGNEDNLNALNTMITRDLIDIYGIQYQYRELRAAHSFAFCRRFVT